MRLRGCLTRPCRPASWWGRVLGGPEGVRAGWRLLLFLVAALGPLVPEYFGFTALARHLPADLIRPPFHPVMLALNEVIILVPLGVAACSLAYLEDRPLARYGLARGTWRRQFGFGLVAGVACLAGLMAVLRLIGVADIGFGGLGFIDVLRYGAEWLAAALLIGITEEFMFRGYFLATLAGGIGFWPAAVVSSVLFVLIHASAQGEAAIGLADVAAIAWLFCFSLRRTGALWFAIGIHSGWDFGENFLFGTHDSGMSLYATLLTSTPHGNHLLSGGSVGPEGSLLGLAVPAVLALIVGRVYPGASRDISGMRGAMLRASRWRHWLRD